MTERTRETALIRDEIYEETLEECERLLVSVEHEALEIRHTAEGDAKRQAEALLSATTSALDEVTRSAERDRAATARSRVEAERLTVDADKLRRVALDELADIAAQRTALQAHRETIDAALGEAERMRAEAEHIHRQAHDISGALIEAAEARAELLEATLDDRIAEVESTLSVLQSLVLDRQRPLADDHAVLKGILSTAYQEIHAYRNAELAAANRQADALIARAQRAAAQIAAGAQGAVPVVNAELATVPSPPAELAEAQFGAPPPAAPGLRDLPPPPPPPDLIVAPPEGSLPPPAETAEADEVEVASAPEGTPDPDLIVGVVPDGDLADVLTLDPTAEDGLGEGSWTDALGDVINPISTNNVAGIAAPVPTADAPSDPPTADESNQPEIGVPPPPSDDADESEVTIDLASGDGATLTLDGDTSSNEDGDRSVGRFRSFWRSVF